MFVYHTLDYYVALVAFGLTSDSFKGVYNNSNHQLKHTTLYSYKMIKLLLIEYTLRLRSFMSILISSSSVCQSGHRPGYH